LGNPSAGPTERAKTRISKQKKDGKLEETKPLNGGGGDLPMARGAGLPAWHATHMATYVPEGGRKKRREGGKRGDPPAKQTRGGRKSFGKEERKFCFVRVGMFALAGAVLVYWWRGRGFRQKTGSTFGDPTGRTKPTGAALATERWFLTRLQPA